MRALTKKQKKILDNYRHINSIVKLPPDIYSELEKLNDWEGIYQAVDMYLWDNKGKELKTALLNEAEKRGFNKDHLDKHLEVVVID